MKYSRYVTLWHIIGNLVRYSVTVEAELKRDFIYQMGLLLFWLCKHSEEGKIWFNLLSSPPQLLLLPSSTSSSSSSALSLTPQTHIPLSRCHQSRLQCAADDWSDDTHTHAHAHMFGITLQATAQRTLTQTPIQMKGDDRYSLGEQQEHFQDTDSVPACWNATDVHCILTFSG